MQISDNVGETDTSKVQLNFYSSLAAFYPRLNSTKFYTGAEALPRGPTPFPFIYHF